jgi:hypothetical protein
MAGRKPSAGLNILSSGFVDAKYDVSGAAGSAHHAQAAVKVPSDLKRQINEGLRVSSSAGQH